MAKSWHLAPLSAVALKNGPCPAGNLKQSIGNRSLPGRTEQAV